MNILLLIHVLDKDRRESLVNPCFRGMRVNRVPDRFAGLLIFREAMPVCCRALERLDCRMVQEHIVLTQRRWANLDNAALAFRSVAFQSGY